MILIVILTHFILGNVCPFLVRKTSEAIDEYQYNKNWLNNGVIHHHHYHTTKRSVAFWFTLSLIYICVYGFIIYVSLNIL